MMKKAILFLSFILCFVFDSKAQKPMEQPNKNYFTYK